jgi:hypothetical protein
MGAFFRKAAVWILGAVGIGPLFAKGVEKWADRNGFLDDPTKGLQWALAATASITDLPYFYPTLLFAVGLALGLWFDKLIRKATQSKKAELRDLGYGMTGFAQDLAHRIRISLDAWPENSNSLFPQMRSIFIRLEKADLWSPPPRIIGLQDNGNLLINYFRYVGTMLADDHHVQARAEAKQFKLKYEMRIKQIDA